MCKLRIKGHFLRRISSISISHWSHNGMDLAMESYSFLSFFVGSRRIAWLGSLVAYFISLLTTFEILMLVPHDVFSLGYPYCQEGYQLYDIDRRKTFTSCDVIFYEDQFPFFHNFPVLPCPFDTWDGLIFLLEGYNLKVQNFKKLVFFQQVNSKLS